MSDVPGARIFIDKVLVSEKALLERGPPLHSDDVIRGWTQDPDGSVKPMERPPQHAVLLGWAPGAGKNMAKTGQKKDISYQGGRLRSACAWSGIPPPNEKTIQGFRIRAKGSWTVWHHRDVPCGFAEAHFQTLYSIGDGLDGGFQNDFYIQDAGTGAVSELPEDN